jgi:hypothetical protein
LVKVPYACWVAVAVAVAVVARVVTSVVGDTDVVDGFTDVELVEVHGIHW